MKTADFLTALGNINEKYVQQLLEEEAASADSTVSADAAGTAGAAASAETPPIRMTKPAGENVQHTHAAPEQKPGAEHPVSGIFRYIVLAASAAACIGVISMIIMMNRGDPDDLVKESVPAEVTEITASTETTAAETELTDLTVLTGTAPVTETALLTEEQLVTVETTSSADTTSDTASTVSAEETTTETASVTRQAQITQTVPNIAAQGTAAQSTSETTTTTVTTADPYNGPQLNTPPTGPPNSVLVRCYDLATMQPLAGVKISLIETPNSDPKTVESWVSDSTGTHTVDGLTKTGHIPDAPYTVRIDAPPDGYIGGYDAFVSWEYLYGYIYEATYYFVSEDIPKNICATVIDAEDDTVHNDLAPYEIYMFDPENMTRDALIYQSVMPGEEIALPDGSYYAFMNSSETEKKGYREKEFYRSSYPNSFMIDFTVTDGIPDKELIFYAEKTSFALYGGEAFEATLTEPADN